VRAIAKQEILEMTRTNPKFSMEFNSCLAQRYANALMMRELMGVKSAEERLLTWLRWETDNGSRTLDLGGRVGSIAPQIGLSREAIYRAMGKLKEQGKIHAEGGTIDLVQ
jgi:CRP-like cAMP-binding protein